jgi:hypothetical protein
MYVRWKNFQSSGTLLAPSSAGNNRTVLICGMIPSLGGNRVVYNGIVAATMTHHGLLLQEGDDTLCIPIWRSFVIALWMPRIMQ